MENILFSKFSCKRAFGIELEVGNEIPLSCIRDTIKDNSFVPVKTAFYRASLNNAYWDVKHDGSCGKHIDKYGINEGGYEVCSYKAVHLNDLFHICNIAKTLKGRGCKVNPNCGLHIHIDASDFSIEQMGMLIGAWCCIEDTVLQVAHPSRRKNKYCGKFINSRAGLPDEATPSNLWNFYKPKSTKLHDNYDRRLTLNLVNYFRHLNLKKFRRPTIEFRFPEGTLDAVVIKNWVRLFINFVNRMSVQTNSIQQIRSYNLEDTLKTLGLMAEKNEFLILSPGLHETKKWFLKRIMKFADIYHNDLAFKAEEILLGMEK
jgi:hypothetical protein